MKIDDFLQEPHSICLKCNNLTPVKTGVLVEHSVRVNGHWIDAHPDEMPPRCEGSGFTAGVVKPYIEWDIR